MVFLSLRLLFRIRNSEEVIEALKIPVDVANGAGGH